MKTMLDQAEMLSDVRDPFSGALARVGRFGIGWIAGAVSEHGSWMTTAQPTREQAVQVAKQRVAGWKPEAPAKEPNLVCPLDGGPIELVFESMGWCARGRLWFSTPFGSREEAVWYVSCRGGITPDFPRKTIISVRERQPDKTAELQVELNEQHRKGREVTNETVDKIFHAAGMPAKPPRGKRIRG